MLVHSCFHRKAFAAIFAVVVLTACATPSGQKKPGDRMSNAAKETGDAAKTARQETRDGFGNAVRQPARDLNIEREEIPPILVKLKTPYAPIPSVSCSRLAGMIKELDLVLGPDVDAPETKGSGEKAGEAVADATLGAVGGAASSFIPFRGLVRQATGASRYERKVRAAYQRGVSRRAYLKGVGLARGCKAPAAPRR